VSRWPEIAASGVGVPDGKRAFPPEVHVRRASGSTWPTSRRHASSAAIASIAFALGLADPYAPSSATPTEPVLKPSACAPTTFRSTPP
jgi:hypothetical protein